MLNSMPISIGATLRLGNMLGNGLHCAKHIMESIQLFTVQTYIE